MKRTQEEDRYQAVRNGIRAELAQCDCVLAGLGGEWEKGRGGEIRSAYQALSSLLAGKNYFVVTTATDARIFESGLARERITAPCGNVNWLQCARGCTKDIWERGEIGDGRCPHCGAPLVPNTIQANPYIEEGYLPSWNAYRQWLSHTLGKRLLILELGVGFRTPAVIRWPFEKTVYFNRKAHMYRINGSFFQIAEEIRDRAVPVEAYSPAFVCRLAEEAAEAERGKNRETDAQNLL